MQSLELAFTGWEGKGRKIDIPFRQVAELVDYRTGDIAVLAGAPGGGKSLTAINWAWRSKDPILYLAQDSPRSVLKRFIALALSRRVDEIDEDEAVYWGTKIGDLGEREELIVDTSGAHTVEQITEKVMALTEWLMESPRLVMIDNLYNVRGEGSYMDNSFYGDVLPALKQMALDLDVGIMLLHHVTRSGESGKKHGLGDTKVRLTDLLYAGEREARHVWAVSRGWDNQQINFQILKQQDGEADAGGNLNIRLDWHPEEGTLWDR